MKWKNIVSWCENGYRKIIFIYDKILTNASIYINKVDRKAGNLDFYIYHNKIALLPKN